MQGTIINKLNAQIIYGPANHTYVNPISPFIKYHWDITGAASVTYSGANIANGAEDERADIIWDWNNLPTPPLVPKIEITEEPLFGNYSKTILNPDYPNNNINQIPEGSIQTKINEIVATGPNFLNGRGTLYIGPGTYYIEEIKLAAGVRIVGAGVGVTILKRTDNANALPPLNPGPNDPPCTPAQINHSKMLTTYWNPSGSQYNYSFLPISNMNSSPIEIANLTIDGSKTIIAANIPICATTDSWENSALIYLSSPWHLPKNLGIVGNYWVKGNNHGVVSDGTLYNNPNNIYYSGGTGKLKVFIHNVEFINSGGDAVVQDGNVDLTMKDCQSTDIYRGTHTITTGADFARLKNIETSTNAPVLTKAIDYEVLPGQHGYNSSLSFRSWLDGCNFDKNVNFDITHNSKLLLTGTHVHAPPTIIIGHTGGDIVTSGSTLSFSPGFGEIPDFIYAPNHAKFNTTTFKIWGGPPNGVPLGCSTFNGLYFKNLTTENNQTVVKGNSHIGFNNCNFVDAMNDINFQNNINFPFNQNTNSIIGQKFGLYLFNNNANNNIPLTSQNNPAIVQLFFKNNTIDNSFSSQVIPKLYNDASCPSVFSSDFEPGIINDNLEYTGGESEDEMKEHFGVRTFNFSQDPCDFPLVADPNIQTMINPTATALIVPPQGANINGRKFIIEGSLTIDQNINFTNCTFYMKTSSTINVAANKTLTLTNCTLQAACKEMWNGIYASDPTAQIFMEGCTLQEAENGVSLINNAKGSITANHFSNNHENIQIFGNTDAANCTINKNDFTFTGGLLAPYVGEKPLHGIYIDNCSFVDIGHPNDATSGNHFSNIWNGVTTNIHQYITGEFPFQQINIYGYSKIQLFNNEFIDINQDLYVNPVNIYDEVGVAVYGHRQDPFNELRVNVSNTLPVATNPTESIENCYIGIWLRNASGTVDRQKIKSGNFGFVATECEGKRIRVADNQFEGTYFNILKSGDETSNGFYAINNTITLPFDALMQYLIPLPPVGIASTYSSMQHVGKSNILNNSVTMPLGNAGIGISLSEGSVDNIFSNQIHMTTPNIELAGIPKMLGIYSNNCTGVNFIDNTVDNGVGSEYVKTKNAGIYLNSNKNSLLRCNNLNYTKMGVFAVGQNGSLSDYDRTVGNYMNNSDANLMLWKLGLDGSMGQVGIEDQNLNFKYDANNTYNDPQDINPLMTQALYNKVYRITDCSTQVNHEIVTTAAKLDQLRSTVIPGNALDCKVTVTTPATFTTTFTCPPGGNNGAATTTLPMDFHYAIMVATGQIDYTEFMEGARRANKELVQQWLASNDSVRNSNPTLSTFYTAMNSQIVGQLNVVERQISLLNDSTLRSTPLEWMTAYNTARTLNNNLSDSLVFEQNAKYMNNLYLNTLLRGRDTLNAEQQEDVETLAFTCPYIGGNAVYRARVLHGMYHFGIHYDDLEICNGQGVYKNGTSKLQQQLDQLRDYVNNKKGKLGKVLLENEIVVYPNPATTEITIEYNFDKGEVADFVIFDMLGRESLRTKLYGNVLNTKVSTIKLLHGIYLYKISKQDKTNYTGKLIIE